MNELIRVAADVQGFCESRRWGFCLIGGLALQRWGEPRETVDVDLTLLTGFGGEDPFIHALLDRYESRIDDAAGFARANRVLLLRSGSGMGIDVALEQEVPGANSLPLSVGAFPARSAVRSIVGSCNSEWDTRRGDGRTRPDRRTRRCPQARGTV